MYLFTRSRVGGLGRQECRRADGEGWDYKITTSVMRVKTETENQDLNCRTGKPKPVIREGICIEAGQLSSRDGL